MFYQKQSSKPIVCQSNKLTRKQNEMLSEKMGELLKIGVIQHSNSDWCSNAYVKELKNGKLLLYVNYSKLNETLEEMDFWPLAFEDELKDFKKSSVFTKLVIKDAFYQIPMNAKDKKKTAFLTEIGKFEFNVMPYNLKNSEKTLNKMLRKAIGYGDSIKVHSDQILVHTEDLEKHLVALKKVLKDLREANFKVDAKESCFCVENVSFAGYQISSKGFEIDPDCIEKIRIFPTPKSASEMSSFLDLTNPYKKFIQNYDILIQPLSKLSKKDENIPQDFSWNLNAKNAFHQLFTDLVNAPALAFFTGHEMRIKLSVSLEGYTSVLEQKDEEGNWNLLEFDSLYRKSEKSDWCRDLERQAVLDTINSFENLIDGENVKIITKHDAFGFLHIPRIYRNGELYFYQTFLSDHGISVIEHDQDSKCDIYHNCFDGKEINDPELNKLWFSDSD